MACYIIQVGKTEHKFTFDDIKEILPSSLGWELLQSEDKRMELVGDHDISNLVVEFIRWQYVDVSGLSFAKVSRLNDYAQKHELRLLAKQTRLRLKKLSARDAAIGEVVKELTKQFRTSDWAEQHPWSIKVLQWIQAEQDILDDDVVNSDSESESASESRSSGDSSKKATDKSASAPWFTKPGKTAEGGHVSLI